MVRPLFSFIVFTRDAELALPITLANLDQFLAMADFDYEILLIDDGSRDASAKIVRAFASWLHRARVIANADALGVAKSAYLVSLTARGAVRIFLDGRLGAALTKDFFARIVAYGRRSHAPFFTFTLVSNFSLVSWFYYLYEFLVGFWGRLWLKTSPGFFPTTVWGLDSTFDPEIFRKIRSGDSLAWLEAELIFAQLGFPRNHVMVPAGVFPNFEMSFAESLHIFSGIAKMRWWLNDSTSPVLAHVKAEANSADPLAKVLPMASTHSYRIPSVSHVRTPAALSSIPVKSGVSRLKSRKNKKTIS